MTPKNGRENLFMSNYNLFCFLFYIEIFLLYLTKDFKCLFSFHKECLYPNFNRSIEYKHSFICKAWLIKILYIVCHKTIQASVQLQLLNA